MVVVAVTRSCWWSITRTPLPPPTPSADRRLTMRSILLYFLGVPIPIIILIALFWH
jgi:cytochrome b561